MPCGEGCERLFAVRLYNERKHAAWVNHRLRHKLLTTGEQNGMNSFATRARRTRRTCGERVPLEVGGDVGAVVRYYGGLQAGYEYQAQ